MAKPKTDPMGPTIGSSASMPVGFRGSGPTSLRSIGPTRSVVTTIPRTMSTTMAGGSHRHRGDAAEPFGNRATSSRAAPPAIRAVQFEIHAAAYGCGRPPGFVNSA
ncbi:MAG TPA: hypothetical protein VGL16_06520 [Actinomycetota bacterium]